VEKFKIVYYSLREKIDTDYYIQEGYHTYYTWNTIHLEKVHFINDFGVFFDSTLSFREHISQKNNKAYSMIGIIKRNFIHMGAKSILLYKTLVRPSIEYQGC